MKITKENYKIVPVKEQELLSSLLDDMVEINKVRPDLYIDWEDRHTDYSPERVDPCPDYYGTYSIRTNGNEMTGLEMDINELDNAMCLINDLLIEYAN